VKPQPLVLAQWGVVAVSGPTSVFSLLHGDPLPGCFQAANGCLALGLICWNWRRARLRAFRETVETFD
jgi:hypothetical protein